MVRRAGISIIINCPGRLRFGFMCRQARLFSTIRNVGFIGLGQMGRRMVKNILKSRKLEKLTVFDSHKAAVEVFQHEAVSASGLKDFTDSDAVFLMLPTGESVSDVLFARDGLINFLRKGAVVVNSGTIGVNCSKEIEKELGNLNIKFVDAPVSGGTIGAENATLTFMVGGCNKTIQSLETIFLTMGKRVVQCGDVGKGQAAKICNNMLLAITMLGAAETFALARKMGLDPKLLTDIINTSSGRCWVTEVNNPVPGIVESSPASQDYQVGFSSQLILKDIRLAIEEAALSHLDLTELKSCEHQFSNMIANENVFASKDMSVVYQYLIKSSK